MTDTGAAGGLAGLNVAATPSSPTTVHWVADGHVIALRSRLASSVTCGGVPGGAAGSNVTWPVGLAGDAQRRTRARPGSRAPAPPPDG